MNNIIISVDGPAGSGKARIAKYIARRYHLYHLDSGLLYRRLVSKILKNKINYKNPIKLKNFINSIKYISPRSHKSLRIENVGIKTSEIATIPIIREFVNSQQKIIVKKMFNSYRGCVIDGRDIGSKVFKNAKIKLFIEVSPKIRSKRRHKQLIEQGEKSIYAEILKEINLRDKTDINRKESPLQIANGSITIENSGSFRNTITQIKKVLKKI